MLASRAVVVLVSLGIAACSRSGHGDAPASGAPSAAAPAPVAPNAASSRPTPAPPLDPHGPELALLGLDHGPDAPGGGRLGSRFVKKVVLVDVGRPEIEGVLVPEIATRLVDGTYPALHACYRERLATAPTIAGDLRVALAIDARGHVTDTTTSGSLDDASLVACTTRALSALAFPARGAKALRVTYPVRFALGTTVGGESILGVGADDVAAALARAGCTDVANRGLAHANGPTIFSAQCAGRAVAVAWVSTSGTRLPDATLERLADHGALYHESDPFVLAVAVEGDADHSRATELLHAIVQDPK